MYKLKSIPYQYGFRAVKEGKVTLNNSEVYFKTHVAPLFSYPDNIKSEWLKGVREAMGGKTYGLQRQTQRTA